MFVAAAPGFETLANLVTRGLVEVGAAAALDATGVADPVLAAEANRYAADLFLAFRSGDAPGCRCSYFESGRFRSEAGFAVADAVSRELAPIFGGEPCVSGRTYAVLRETRMAAVICEPVAADDLGGMRTLVRRGADVAACGLRGRAPWASSSLPLPNPRAEL